MLRKILILILLNALIIAGWSPDPNHVTQAGAQKFQTLETITSKFLGKNDVSDGNDAERSGAYPPSVMVDGIIYQDTGYVDSMVTCGMMDGQITSTVDGSKLPNKNDQSNFGSGYEYQLSVKDQLVVQIDGQYLIFRNIESEDDSIPDQVLNFLARVKEINDGVLLVSHLETAEGFQEMMSGDYSVSAENLIDEVAPGDTVKIWFDGLVAETYPYQLNQVYRIIKMSSSNESISWDEISERGVDEDLLFENVNQENLEKVAAELQDLVDIIIKKGEADRSYWFTPQWFSDAKSSEQYARVVSMGTDAVKPLYLIIYKSPNEGLYEYICAMALDELTGYSLEDEYPVEDWVSSKDFLEKFNKKILEERAAGIN